MTDGPVAESPATHAMAALLDELVRAGVEHLVVCPGSRSQALALAAADLQRRGRASVHVRIDERVAGFTALGIGRETRRPAAVIVTSGTAAANLLPAVLEAHHAGVPVLILTADRPPELRGVGANQTTRQPGLFSGFTRFDADAPVPTDPDADSSRFRDLARTAWDAATATPAGPVHLNLPVREPLAGSLPSWWTSPDDPADPVETPDAAGAMYQGGGGIGDAPTDETDADAERWPQANTVVIAGADAGAAAEDVAHRFGWPLVAEIVSGARFGRNLVHGYRELLREDALGGRIERAVVFGHPTLTREVTALLQRPDIEILTLPCGGEAVNLNGAAREIDVATLDAAAPVGDREWLGAWMRASATHVVDLTQHAPDVDGLASDDGHRRREAVDAEVNAMRAPITREALVDAVWRTSWPHDRLLFGSSRLVRVADAVLGGKKVPVHANRGLAGIDGTVATGIGIAVASQTGGAPGVTRVLLGDLTLLHDVGALLFPGDEDEPRIQVIVGNDGGGTIFDGLEVAQVADPADFARVQYTPHTVRLEHLALAYGWEYRRVTTRSALDAALATSVGGRQLIEVPLPR